MLFFLNDRSTIAREKKIHFCSIMINELKLEKKNYVAQNDELFTNCYSHRETYKEGLHSTLFPDSARLH